MTTLERVAAGLTPGDILVAVVVTAAVGLGWGWALGGESTARGAEIQTADGATRRISLEDDHLHRVAGPLGETVIEVRDGRLRFLDSPCTGRICMNAGWLEQAGAVQACLPNRVTVRLVGGDERYDSMVY